MLHHIAVIGPESTGKTVLANQLAQHYQGVYVTEFARNYLENLGRNYMYEDLLIMAKGQIELKHQAIEYFNENNKKLKPFIFYDTTLTVIKIWSELKFGKCDAWILESLKREDYNIQLLTDVDLPWEYDPLRENEHNRQTLFDIYKTELQKQKVNFRVISGYNQERLQNAISIIDNQLSM